MDNSQFRNLVAKQAGETSHGASQNAKPPAGAFKTPMLGSRARASIPMTPRSVAGYNGANEFARQVAEHRRNVDGQPPTKKFKTSVPKGTKLAQGYQDRTSLRRAVDDADSQDDKEKRLQALEEMLKLQQIDQATFDHLRSQIGIGGDVGSTHLVKGLDWKLLERVRRGEDITTNESSEAATAEEDKADVDDELDDALHLDARAVERSTRKEEDRSGRVPDGAPAARKLTRDEILQRLKASRRSSAITAAAPMTTTAALPEQELGDRFKKVTSGSQSQKKRFVEVVDGRRREVLLTTDKEGNAKRKVRWLDKEPDVPRAEKLPPQLKPLGMEVPAEFAAKQKALEEQQRAEEEEDDDIFAGVGTNYNPLNEMGEDGESDSSGHSDGGEIPFDAKAGAEAPRPTGGDDASAPRRNYFGTSGGTEQAGAASRAPGADADILAALKRAAALRKAEAADGHQSHETTTVAMTAADGERALKHQQFLKRLKQRDREDAQDLDLGFGASRFGDEDDEEGGVVYGDVDGGQPGTEEPQGRKGGAAGGRKRGPKKRKGNKDSVHDVMHVLEGRKTQAADT